MSIYARAQLSRSISRELLRFHIHRDASAKSLDRLESRVRNMHPALKIIRVTHRWAGPILITKGMHPVFRHHAHHKIILTLPGFSGHGVPSPST